MGHGYCILVWDDFGSGLVKINPRLHTSGVDQYNNPQNWWSCTEDTTEEQVAELWKLDEKYKHFHIIFD